MSEEDDDGSVPVVETPKLTRFEREREELMKGRIKPLQKTETRRKFKRSRAKDKKSKELPVGRTYPKRYSDEDYLDGIRPMRTGVKRRQDEILRKPSVPPSHVNTKVVKSRSVGEIRTLISRLDPTSTDEIKQNLFLRRQAVQAIADFTSEKSNEDIRKALVTSRERGIPVLLELLLSLRQLNGTVEYPVEQIAKRTDERELERAVILDTMEADTGYEALQKYVRRKFTHLADASEEEQEEHYLRYYMHQAKSMAKNVLTALSNIASGPLKHSREIAEANCFEAFSQIGQRTSDFEIMELVIWTVGNCANNSSNRTLLYNVNILKVIAYAIHRADANSHVKLFRTSAWAYSNLTRDGVNSTDFKFFSLSTDYSPLATIIQMLHHSDEEVMIHSCWAISNLTQHCTENEIEVVLDHGLVPRIVELMMHPHQRIQWRSVRTVGNILSGTDKEANSVLECGALTHIKSLLDSDSFEIRRTACFALSNITAANRKDLLRDALFTDSTTLPRLVELSRKDDLKIRKEAVFALCNAILSGTAEQRLHLVRAGVVETVIDILDKNVDQQLFLIIMSCLLNLLTIANNEKWTMVDVLPTQKVSQGLQEKSAEAKALPRSRNLVAQILDQIGGWGRLEEGKDVREYADHVLIQDLLKFKDAP